MADSIFSLYDNLNQPSQTGFDSFQDLLARQRAQLQQTSPDVANQLPVLGAATPGQRMYQANQENPTQPTDPLANTIQQGVNALAQTQVQPGAKPKEIQAAQQQAIDSSREVLKPLNPMEPKPTYGPQGFGEALGMPKGSGGILGLGIQPIDLLSFAIFAGLTRNMPQDQAMKMTMWGAGLPSRFRDNQEEAALRWVREQASIAGLQNQTTHMNMLQRQDEEAQRKQTMVDVVGYLADRGVKNIPPSLLIGAGVPVATSVGLQASRMSIQNTPDGLVAVDTANGTVKPILDANGQPIRRSANPNAYNDMRDFLTKPVDQGGMGLTPGTATFQNEADKRMAAQAGAKAGATAAAQQPFKLEVIDKRAADQRQNIDYRLKALGNAPVQAKDAPYWVDGNGGRILPPGQLLGRTPSEVLAQYPQATRLANAQERNALASATSLIDIRDKLAPILPQILTKYGDQKLTDILGVQGNKLIVKLRGAAGDPLIARANAYLTDFLVEAPLAMGMVAGREGPELLKRYESGMPNISGNATLQSALAGMDANIQSVATRWQKTKGINIFGSEAPNAAPAGGAVATPPAGAVIRRFNPATGKFE